VPLLLDAAWRGGDGPEDGPGVETNGP
jgi:hypothetical protein